MINASFGRGQTGSPGDPEQFVDLADFAAAIEETASIKVSKDMTKAQYERTKGRGPWVMRAIDEATAFDSQKDDWHRRIGSVTQVDWLMFDADKMPVGSRAAVRQYLLSQNIPHIIYRSTGNGLDCKGNLEAFRIIIPCKPVAADISQAATRWLRTECLEPQTNGGEWDAACDQPTRIIYLPPVGEMCQIHSEGAPLDCAKIFTENGLTINERKGQLERGEADVGPFGDFVDHLIDEYAAVIVEKPDGRVAVQMAGLQSDKYSSPNDNDDWNWYLPSGEYTQLVFKSLHENTEGHWKTSDAVNCMAEYGDKDAARLYAQAIGQQRDIESEIREKMMQVDGLPATGRAPKGSDLEPIAFYRPSAFQMPKRADKARLPPKPGKEPKRSEFPKGEEGDRQHEEAYAEFEQELFEYEEDMNLIASDLIDYQAKGHKYFNDSFVLVVDVSKVANLNHPASEPPVALRAFQVATANQRYTIINGKDDLQSMPFSEAWLTSEQRQDVQSVRYSPGKPRVYEDENGIRRLNSFYMKPFEYTEDESLLDDFFWLVDRTHPIEKEANLFIDWLAYSFRYPHERILWAYVNISEARGSGRGTLLNIMRTLFGGHNTTSTGVNNVDEDKYHDYLYESLICAVEEADHKANGGRVKIADHWNEAITTTNKLLNLKSRPQVKADVYANMAMFLNSASLIIDPEDRRINATTGAPADTPQIPPDQAAAMSRLFRSNAFRDQLASFLWRRDLHAFNPSHSDRTLPARALLLANSKSFNEEAVDEVFDALPGRIITAAHGQQLMAKLLENNKLLNKDAVTALVGKRIKDRMKVKSRAQGKPVACWFLAEPSTIANASAELELTEKVSSMR